MEETSSNEAYQADEIEYEVEEEDIVNELDEDDTGYDELEAEKFSEIVSFTTDWTVETIISQIIKKNIKLDPEYQRRNAWSTKKKSQFIESLLLNIPIPNILLGEERGKKGNFTVIDGKQRLLTLLEFYGVENAEGRKKSFKLSKQIEILHEYKGKGYKQLQQLDISITNSLDNYSIRTSVLRNIPSNMYLYEIFKRINSGSEKLSPQELRQSKFHGKFTSYLIKKSIDNSRIQRILKIKQVHARMKDVELILRCYAYGFNLQKYNNSISRFLDDTTQVFNDEWNEQKTTISNFYSQIEIAIDFSFEVFDEEAFTLIGIQREKKAFNRPVFDLMVYFFTNENTRELIRSQFLDLKIFKRRFIEMFKDNDTLLESVTQNTHQTSNTFKRFVLTFDILKELIGGLPNNSSIETIRLELIKNEENK